MIGQRKKIPRFQSVFYRDNYYKMLRALFVSISVIILLILAIIYFVLFPIAPTYYASTTTGQTIPLEPFQ